MTAPPSVELPCPAKINLFLHVTGRRDDGYHTLQTLFQFLDHGDRIGLIANRSGLIDRVDDHDFPLPDQDLCVNAAKLLRDHVGREDLGATITLTKKIPPGTGLGAGSSNAASVLLGLNQLWNLDLPQRELLPLAARLGADVPVFVGGESAWAEGVGDELRVTSFPTPWFAVLLPPVSVSTREVFEAPGLARATPVIEPADWRYETSQNDLEPVTRSLYPAVDAALSALEHVVGQQDTSGGFVSGAPRMSGSGSAVYAPCATEADADRILTQTLAHLESVSGDNEGFVARGLSSSPLHAAL